MKDWSSKLVWFLVIVFLALFGYIGYKLYNTNNIEIRSTDSYIQYKKKDSSDWVNLVSLETLTGKDGKEVEIKKIGKLVRWKYKDSNEWTDLINLDDITGLRGKSGKDGREIELTSENGYIKYKYKGSKNWTNLVKLSSLSNSKEIELNNDGTNIKWKYKDSEEWINLISIDALKGQDNSTFINLGVIDTNKYCDKDNNCGNEWYLRQNFVNALDGSYVYTDKVDNSLWRVNVERLENDSDKFVLIKYWSSDEVYPHYIKCIYNKETDSFETSNITFVDFNSFTLSINEIKDKVSTGGWNNLGNVNVKEGCSEDDCVLSYIKNNLTKEGKYIFNDGNNIFHVNSEVATDNDGNKQALISYWSSEDIKMNFIPGWYYKDTDKWIFGEEEGYASNKVYTSIEDIRNEINKIKDDMKTQYNELKSEFSKNDSVKNLGKIDVNEYCEIDNPDDCGATSYIKNELINTGKYIFEDKNEGFKYYVDTAFVDESGDNKNIIIKYLSTEENVIYILRGTYDQDKWIFNENYLIESKEFNETKNNIDKRFNALEIKLINYKEGTAEEAINDYFSKIGSNEYQAISQRYKISKLVSTSKYDLNNIYLANVYKYSTSVYTTDRMVYIEYFNVNNPSEVKYTTGKFDTNNKIALGEWKTK